MLLITVIAISVLIGLAGILLLANWLGFKSRQKVRKREEEERNRHLRSLGYKY